MEKVTSEGKTQLASSAQFNWPSVHTQQPPADTMTQTFTELTHISPLAKSLVKREDMGQSLTGFVSKGIVKQSETHTCTCSMLSLLQLTAGVLTKWATNYHPG